MNLINVKCCGSVVVDLVLTAWAMFYNQQFIRIYMPDPSSVMSLI